MRILVVSNLYPPHYIGGYELGCREIIERLRCRGHRIEVLTSTYGAGRRSNADAVRRLLKTELNWLSAARAATGDDREPEERGWLQSAFASLRPTAQALWAAAQEAANASILRRTIRSYAPDVLYLWNLENLSRSLGIHARSTGVPTAYFVSSDWLERYPVDPWYTLWHGAAPNSALAAARTLIRPLARRRDLIPPSEPEFQNAQFASEHLRRQATEAGVCTPGARVIRWGVDTDRFAPVARSGPPKRLLFVGQLVQHKGVHTLIEAMDRLVNRESRSDLRLTIVGGGIHREYVERLNRSVTRLGLDENVRFTDLMPREELPRLYRDHDVLVFPSIWPEPFSITLLEAMATGLAVVSTATGGTPEILRDEQNALIFQAEDSADCARQIGRMIDDRELWRRCADAAARTIRERYGVGRMIDAVEAALMDAAR